MENHPALRLRSRKQMHFTYFSICLFVCLLANQLPAGLITADGQQQNVMVYTTSYQQVLYFLCILNYLNYIHWFFFLKSQVVNVNIIIKNWIKRVVKNCFLKIYNCIVFSYGYRYVHRCSFSLSFISTGSTPWIQPAVDHMLSPARRCLNPQMESAGAEPMDTERWLKDLSICAFWHPQGILEPVHCGSWGNVCIHIDFCKDIQEIIEVAPFRENGDLGLELVLTFHCLLFLFFECYSIHATFKLFFL